MDNNPEVRYAGVISDSIVDGPGLRLCVFFQGCPHHCEGCHNPETHDPNGGYSDTLIDFTDKILGEFAKNPLLAGVTLSGGEPVYQLDAALYIARAVVGLGGSRKKDVVLFTGYTFEQLLAMAHDRPKITELLSLTTLLVDGRFELDERDLTLQFRGSRNQRLINAKASLAAGAVVPWKSKWEF